MFVQSFHTEKGGFIRLGVFGELFHQLHVELVTQRRLVHAHHAHAQVLLSRGLALERSRAIAHDHLQMLPQRDGLLCCVFLLDVEEGLADRVLVFSRSV